MIIEIKRAADIPNRPKKAAKTGAGRPAVYPFGEMKIGDAFLLPADHPGAQRSGVGRQTRVGAAARSFSRIHGVEIHGRLQEDGSVRVERIS